MGFLRLLLAISVVVYHRDVRVHFLVGGLYAVKLFFIISGFYMALILHEKYTGERANRLFYCNRLLRLLPGYYVILGLFLVTPWMGGLFLGRPITFGNLNYWKVDGANLPEWLSLSLKWLHVTPLGQEVQFFGYEIQFVTPPKLTALQIYSFMLLPPAWSLSLELQFYALAPYLVRRSAAVLALHFLPVGNAIFWRYFSLPGNLGYFILGIAGYRIYRTRNGAAWLGWLAERGRWLLAVLLAWLVAYPWLPAGARETLTTAGFALALPFVFAASSSWRWDRALGELSYPLYLCHWLVMNVWDGLEPLVHKRIPAVQYDWMNVLLVVIGSLGLAGLIHYGVERPIDHFRQRMVQRKWIATPPPGP